MNRFVDISLDFIKLLDKEPRVLAAKDNTPLHHVADANIAPLSVAVRYAFAKGRAALSTRNPDVVENAVRKALLDVLPGTLLKTMTVGGDAALKMIGLRLKAAGGAGSGNFGHGGRPGEVGGSGGQGQFVYHGTSAENLSSIQIHGLRPNTYGNPLNFHHVEESSAFYAGSNGLLMRVRKTDLPKDTTHDKLTARSWTSTAVQPHLIEVKKGDSWMPLPKLKVASFNPDQERDDHGRWTQGGASGTVFHGTVSPNVQTIKPNVNGVVFLTPDETAAVFHATRDARHRDIPIGQLQGAVHSVDLSLKNPLEISTMAFDRLTNDKKFIAKAKADGHDALVSDDGRAIAVFHAVTVGKSRLITSEARTLAGPVKIRFDNTNPNAAKWAKDHATELADDLSTTTRDRVTTALEDLFNGDATLDDVRNAVGDDTRAEVIARTESMRAVNEGQRQGWDQAVEAGLLDENSKRVWIATPDCCDICDELDGEETTLDGEYLDPGGDGPPQHPNCRCTEGISG